MDILKSTEERIAEIRFNVDKATDKLGTPIDEGIKDTVIYLNALGLKTSQSCEGHLLDEDGHELPRSPFVEIYPDEPERPDWVDDPELAVQMKQKSKEIYDNLTVVLEEFYKEIGQTTGEEKLTLWQIAYGWRIEPESTEKLASLQGKDAEDLLAKQQHEMKRFTAFLEGKLQDQTLADSAL